MRKSLSLLFGACMVCMTLAGCSYTFQKPMMSDVKNPIIDDREPVVDDRVDNVIEEVIVTFESLEKSDIYNCINNNLDEALILKVEEYILSEITKENFTDVVLLDIWYNYNDCETQFKLLFDEHYFRQIAIPDDLSDCDVLYNSFLTDYTLKSLGYMQEDN